MASPTTNSNYIIDDPATTLNITPCIENAQERIDFHKVCFSLGLVFPALIWPLLPSTSELTNYRILAFSSAAELAILILWTVCFWTDRAFIYQDFPPWLIFPIPLCFCLVGRAGVGASRLGKSLREADEVFSDAACMTSGISYCVIPMAGNWLLGHLTAGYGTISPRLDIVVRWGALVVSAAVYFLVLDPAVALYYRFATRRIPGLYWLPQNSTQREFNPWWSQILQFAMPFYICVLAYFLLPVLWDIVRKCST